LFIVRPVEFFTTELINESNSATLLSDWFSFKSLWWFFWSQLHSFGQHRCELVQLSFSFSKRKEI